MKSNGQFGGHGTLADASLSHASGRAASQLLTLQIVVAQNGSISSNADCRFSALGVVLDDVSKLCEGNQEQPISEPFTTCDSITVHVGTCFKPTLFGSFMNVFAGAEIVFCVTVIVLVLNVF